jgi:hypothetical protein
VGSLVDTCLAGPVGIHARSRVLVREEADEMRLATQFSQSFGHLRLELLCDVGRKDDLARSGVIAHIAVFEFQVNGR